MLTREFVITQNEKENLSKAERNAIAKMIAQLENSLKG